MWSTGYVGIFLPASAGRRDDAEEDNVQTRQIRMTPGGLVVSAPDLISRAQLPSWVRPLRDMPARYSVCPRTDPSPVLHTPPAVLIAAGVEAMRRSKA